MIELQEVDQTNFYDCIGLTRKSTRYVGNAEFVLAEAYIFRQHSTAYAICDDSTIVGLVILMDRPNENKAYYSFTNLFIADNFQGKKYGSKAVSAIIEKFKAEQKRTIIEIQVHKSNMIAKTIYLNHGFIKVRNAEWDENFEVMQKQLTED